MALKSQAEGIELAESIATVIITGNTAVYGGGIAANGGVVIGTDTEELIDIEVSKEWDDNNAGITNPESVTIYLLNNGYIIDSAELNEENNWTYTFKDLPSTDNFTYTIEEASVIGYDSVITGSVNEGFVITNTVEIVEINGTKTWIDNDNAYDTRPESITINIKNGEEIVKTVKVSPDEDDNWTFSVDLPAYDSSGEKIEYTIEEDEIVGYISEISGDAEEGYNITNILTGTTDIQVNKTWDDADNNWEASFTDLDVYSNGVTIEYTVEEVSVDGYTSEITGNMAEGFVITNTHTPEETPETPNKPTPTEPTTPSTPEENTLSETSTSDTTTEAVETTVKTGDMTQMSLWIALLFVSGCGIVAYKKRKSILKR
ncbi:MAG: Cna B-type domain-containing protein [Erysipelotrichaceae bacterium]|nr:Cna B-type domain-containing protein [Erysipelotrichaceae bacterium]